jgi:hypothetical protein
MDKLKRQVNEAPITMLSHSVSADDVKGKLWEAMGQILQQWAELVPLVVSQCALTPYSPVVTP